MPDQNYSNHVRYYPPHHFVYYPVVLTSAGLAIYFMFRFPGQKLIWLGFAGVFLLLTWLSFMMRQHYALIIQNRLVRVELRLRYYILTQKRLEEMEDRLSIQKIYALRFASDQELVPLIEQTLLHNLTPDQIKKAIQNWLPDTMRV